MLTYQRNLLKARVNTALGSMLLVSWAFGCGLTVWTVAHDQNPLANAFSSMVRVETELGSY